LVAVFFFDAELIFAAGLLFAADSSLEAGTGVAGSDVLSRGGAFSRLLVLFVGLLAGYGVARVTDARTLGFFIEDVLTSVSLS
jgi:hypothetical protein